jgi:manganese/zinc/iron transport system ATP- binding protein
VNAIEVEQLTIHYEKMPVLWDVTFAIPDGGHLAAILGPNGAGKSSLLKALLGIVSPISGKVKFYGASFASSSRRIAYIPQREEIDWDFPITAYEVVLMGALAERRILGFSTKQDRQKARAMLEKVGMSSFAHRQIAKLSGGQQQRLFIARALMQNADIYLMDEPFAGVDATTQQEILDLFHGLKKEGKTLLVVHHDLATVEKHFDWVVILNTCLIGCGPVATTFTTETLTRAYGKSPTLLNEAVKRNLHQQAGIS